MSFSTPEPEDFLAAAGAVPGVAWTSPSSVGALAATAGAPWIETANVRLPTCTRSRSFSWQDAVNTLPLTSVPLRLPRSLTTTESAPMVNSACSRLTNSLLGRRWQVSPRPILKTGPSRGMIFPSGLP